MYKKQKIIIANSNYRVIPVNIELKVIILKIGFVLINCGNLINLYKYGYNIQYDYYLGGFLCQELIMLFSKFHN